MEIDYEVDVTSNETIEMEDLEQNEDTAENHHSYRLNKQIENPRLAQKKTRSEKKTFRRIEYKQDTQNAPSQEPEQREDNIVTTENITVQIVETPYSIPKGVSKAIQTT